jgi:serine/threonine protein kinase
VGNKTPNKVTDENFCDFKTPTKKMIMVDVVPETPTRVTNVLETPSRSAVIPETPPKTIAEKKVTGTLNTRLNKTKLFAEDNAKKTVIVSAKVPTTAPRVQKDTPKSRLQDKAHVTEYRCQCFGKGQVCRICCAKSELIAPRAGTPGFRAPEVLLRSLEQSTAIDVWSAGVILASLTSGRYPFFRNTDDMNSLAEIISLLGAKRVNRAARRMGKTITFIHKDMVDPALPVDNLKTICKKLRPEGFDLELPDSMFDLLDKLLDPSPWTRLRAEEALKHPFITGVDDTPQKAKVTQLLANILQDSSNLDVDSNRINILPKVDLEEAQLRNKITQNFRGLVGDGLAVKV